MSVSRRHLIALMPALLLVGLAPTPATAQTLDEYRAQGIIAERYDGFVEIRVDNPPAKAKEIVERVNKKRRQIYRKRAEAQGVAPEAVGKVYAKQIAKNAPKGTYFKKPDGSYVRK